MSNISDERKVKKEKYLATLEIGSLIAFKTSSEKAETGKVIKKSTFNRCVKAITNYGAEFIVKYEDILWIKTGTRWPKGIYNLLKGKKKR